MIKHFSRKMSHDKAPITGLYFIALFEAPMLTG
jgi:hypothetical protein